mmetsp:Transcript_9534/g.21300  ORF Transcript_9534/g.21300 Transcript_9534/m.21300 type:complete len:230 (+) Transcript_9534:629-1318(+)
MLDSARPAATKLAVLPAGVAQSGVPQSSKPAAGGREPPHRAVEATDTGSTADAAGVAMPTGASLRTARSSTTCSCDNDAFTSWRPSAAIPLAAIPKQLPASLTSAISVLARVDPTTAAAAAADSLPAAASPGSASSGFVRMTDSSRFAVEMACSAMLSANALSAAICLANFSCRTVSAVAISVAACCSEGSAGTISGQADAWLLCSFSAISRANLSVCTRSRASAFLSA